MHGGPASLHVAPGGLDDPRIVALLQAHLSASRANTAAGSAHALDLSGLRGPGVSFFAAWLDDSPVATGALKRLTPDHAELKSMHTVEALRGQGIGGAMLRHLMAVAHDQGVARLSLETGSWPYFAPAVALYRRHGFEPCAPFGAYRADPNSLFMTRELAGPDGEAD